MARLSSYNTDDVWQFAKFLHNEYERAAKLHDWETQEGTSVPFEELPRENQETMLRLALSVLQWYNVEKSEMHMKIDEMIEESGDDGN